MNLRHTKNGAIFGATLYCYRYAALLYARCASQSKSVNCNKTEAYHCTRGDEEIRTGPISSVDRVLVQVYSKGKMALSSKVMLYINILLVHYAD